MEFSKHGRFSTGLKISTEMAPMACFWGVLAPTSQGRARIAGWCGVGKTLLVDSRNAGEACQGSKAGACGPSRRVRSMLDCITRLN